MGFHRPLLTCGDPRDPRELCRLPLTCGDLFGPRMTFVDLD